MGETVTELDAADLTAAAAMAEGSVTTTTTDRPWASAFRFESALGSTTAHPTATESGRRAGEGAGQPTRALSPWLAELRDSSDSAGRDGIGHFWAVPAAELGAYPSGVLVLDADRLLRAQVSRRDNLCP
jgi:hypothetical protein